MKTVLLFCSAILLQNMSFAQGKDWLWGQTSYTSYPSTNLVSGRKIVTDKEGNVYVAGVFYKTDIGFDTAALMNTGGASPMDVFIVKYNRSGILQWLRQIAGSGNTQLETVTGLCFDHAGNILIAGNFNSRFLTLAGTKFTNIYANNFDIFLTCMDHNGNFLWAKQFGGNASQSVSDIVCNPSGEIYITGSFNSVTFTLGNTILTNFIGNITSDAFLAKLDSTGNPVWAKRFGGNDDESPMAMSLGKDGSLLIGGITYSDSLDIGTYHLKGGYMFLCRFDKTGNVLNASIPGNGSINSIISDGSGNFYLAGERPDGTLHFGNITLDPIGGSYRYGDFFVLKMDSAMNPLWIRSGVGNYSSYSFNTVQCLAQDQLGNVYAGGYFNNETITIDGKILRNVSSGSESSDIFLIKYDGNGNLLWLRQISGDGSENIPSACADNNNDVLLTGTYASSICRFGKELTLKPSTPGGFEVFITKLSSEATGLLVSETDQDFILYPNPASQILTLGFAKMIPGPATIRILDMTGAIVLEVDFPDSANKNIAIDISKLNASVYVMQLQTSSTSFQSRFIKN